MNNLTDVNDMRLFIHNIKDYMNDNNRAELYYMIQLKLNNAPIRKDTEGVRITLNDLNDDIIKDIYYSLQKILNK